MYAFDSVADMNSGSESLSSAIFWGFEDNVAEKSNFCKGGTGINDRSEGSNIRQASNEKNTIKFIIYYLCMRH
jgi:hypothetical protein